jgi:hypothetical protein
LCLNDSRCGGQPGKATARAPANVVRLDDCHCKHCQGAVPTSESTSPRGLEEHDFLHLCCAAPPRCPAAGPALRSQRRHPLPPEGTERGRAADPALQCCDRTNGRGEAAASGSAAGRSLDDSGLPMQQHNPSAHGGTSGVRLDRGSRCNSPPGLPLQRLPGEATPERGLDPHCGSRPLSILTPGCSPSGVCLQQHNYAFPAGALAHCRSTARAALQEDD